MAYKTPYYNDQKNDNTLINELSWAGGSFPYAGTSDITISAPTTWSDSAGFKKVRKLTINAGQTLTVGKSPFFIFSEEISFGDTSSIIDASGPSGASSGSFSNNISRGGTTDDGYGRAQAGCGGGMLFVVANKISGANGVIKANGGNGYRNTTGALSNSSSGGNGGGAWLNFTNNSYAGSNLANDFLHTYAHLMSSYGGAGASGAGSPGGGIGSGGSPSQNGAAAKNILTPKLLLELANIGCYGGGGGATYIATTGTGNAAGGGGGGSVVVWYRTATATPTLQANGGTGAINSGANNGGAGVTFYVQV